jgi:small subunit ribosomal protein S15
MLSKELKNELLAKFGRDENDSGSSEVQIALLSARIRQITAHLKTFPKDKHSRCGLLKLVGSRNSLFKYVRRSGSDKGDILLKKVKEAGIW